MNKRLLVAFIFTLILVAVCTAEAQQPKKVPRVGLLFTNFPSTNAARVDAFRQGLRGLGYVEGKNIVIEYRYAEGKQDRFPGPAPTPTVDAPSFSSTSRPDSGVSPVNPGAATNLQIKVECSTTELRKGIAKLSWKVAQHPGSAQRVEVTIYRNGFEEGKFEISGLLSSEQSSLVWERLNPGIIHHWRVVTVHPGGSVPSETVSFEGPICIADIRPK